MALLTGGGDRPYALGLALNLARAGVVLDFIGSDSLEAPELRQAANIRFLNLRGDMNPEASFASKVSRIVRYYGRLFAYAARSKAAVFHILWNNKWESFDRTLLMLYYRVLGKRIVLTVHNVNIRRRDGNDSLVNRATLWLQYRLASHLFVHTELMRQELEHQFGVAGGKVTTIPFGINDTVPNTSLTPREARERLSIGESRKVLLFFGNIAPYKGVEYLVEALALLRTMYPDLCLVIAGRPKGSEEYWLGIERRIEQLGLGEQVVRRIEYVPDSETEVYFKAADALILPYVQIFQSGVLFLGYNFGLPVIATDVGSLASDIVEGETGFTCRPRDSSALADAIRNFLESSLYRLLAQTRQTIRALAASRYSWERVAAVTVDVYRKVSM